jgi:hypothetical protein
MSESRDNPLPPSATQGIRFAVLTATGTLTFTGTGTFWSSYSFAPEWFNDALNEARTGKDHHARRREIIFAICCAESYLVEWIRDEVLNRDFNRLNQFFPPGERRGVAEKWKEVPKELKKAGLIAKSPDLGSPYWQDWLKLVDLRNGLIHAKSSRPETHSQAADERPVPSRNDLEKLPPGWAIKVVVALIRELHATVSTPVPAWLADL